MSNKKRRKQRRKAKRIGEKVVARNDKFLTSLLVAHEGAKVIVHPMKEEIRVHIRELIAMYHNAWSPNGPAGKEPPSVMSLLNPDNPLAPPVKAEPEGWNREVREVK